MKKVLIFLISGVAALSSCRTKCPAYSAAKPATHLAVPAVASTASATPGQ